jgi:hypothetical protein
VGEEDDKIAGVLDRLVHRLDEAGIERNVVVLDDNFVALVGQDVRDLLRNRRHRAAPAQEEIGPASHCARHEVSPRDLGIIRGGTGFVNKARVQIMLAIWRPSSTS